MPGNRSCDWIGERTSALERLRVLEIALLIEDEPWHQELLAGLIECQRQTLSEMEKGETF